MKIIFMGTPDFSAQVLEKLNSRFPVSAVVTALDKPTGRGYKLQPSALKVKAEELGISVLQYAKVSREGIEDIKNLAPDVVITAAFGQILSDEFLSIPKHGVLNVHASLLPKYRGSSPIQQAILDGEEETGITIMRTVKAVDAGDILLQKRVKIGEKETAGELFDRLADLGGEAICEAIELLKSGEATFTPQDHSKATHCKMISKADGEIDFSRKAKELDCFVRGMTPWPSAYSYIGGKTLKIFEIETINDIEKISYLLVDCAFKLNLPIDSEVLKINGTVVCSDTKSGLIVVGNGSLLRLKEIQLEGSKRMLDTEFLNGRRIELGTVLGK